jgi:hypothetical protein
LVAPDFKKTKLSAYYDFYEVINNCVGCPDVRFEIDTLPNNKYRFTPNFEVGDNYEYLFKINEEIISDQTIDENPFIRQFYPGTYNICIKVVTPDCSNGKEFCKELNVAAICPEITYTYEKLTTILYRFTHSVTRIDRDVDIEWYVNDVFVKKELLSVEMVDIELSQGSNVVCAKIYTQQCPDGVKYCEEITVE